ncbi:MAG: A24 family peptidase [Gammaproteobacteria bacterium]
MNPLIAALLDEPTLLVGAMTVLGLLVGSFLNVVVHRLPIMMEREWKQECRSLLELPDEAPGPAFDLVRPRSRCPACGAPIAARDNVPVLGWLLLRGRCRACRAPISVRYPLVEAFTGLVSGFAAWHFGVHGGDLPAALTLARVAAASVVCWYLIALALIDYDTRLLPDSLTQPLLWLGIVASFWGLFAGALEDAVLGAVFGYLSLWSVYWLFKLVTGKEGMGYGDFKLLAALGAWLGWQALPVLVLLSSAVGAALGIGLIASGIIKRSEPIPFGPYLALAGILALFWGDAIGALFSPGRPL